MSKTDTDRINRGQELVGRGVQQAYTQADFSRFPVSPLERMNASLRANPATARSAFLGNMANPFAGSFQQQRTPGAQYVNYERAAPNVGGALLQPQPPAGYVPPGTQPQVIRVNPDGTPAADEEEDDSLNSSLEKALERINALRLIEGKEPYESMAEFQADIRSQIGIGSEGGGFNPLGGMAGMGPMYAAEGGIASIQPMYMSGGGIMGALSSLGSGIGGALSGIGSGIGRGIEALGGLAKQGLENYQANQKKQEKRLEDMTREELIEYIKSGGMKSSGNTMGFNIPGIRAATGLDKGAAAPGGGGNLPMGGYADGGDVDFPRMNGPISGPGTETSDDIPAMLSDGEFVVNAKAVRGIGRLEGAGKSKAEQRREGARMMYALQRAGEKAMRKA